MMEGNGSPKYRPQLRPGSVIVKYQVKEFYRDGAFGELYLVEQVPQLMMNEGDVIKGPLVLKMYKKLEDITSQTSKENLDLLESTTSPEELFEDPRIKKFFSEITALRKAQKEGHANIAKIIDAGMIHTDEQGKARLYLVEEFVEGKTLAEIMAQAPLDGDGLRQMDIGMATEIFYRLASGLDYLHEKCEMAHCDVKGENVIIKPSGEPVLTDFGNARVVTSREYLQRGSILYRSPEELLLTDTPAGKASDIWALGLLMYQSLSGRYPFETTPSDWSGKNSEELKALTEQLKMNIALDQIAPVTRYNKAVPENLREIIKGALKRHPEQRWKIKRIVEVLEQERTRLKETAEAAQAQQ